jgi:hypothetical protein
MILYRIVMKDNYRQIYELHYRIMRTCVCTYLYATLNHINVHLRELASKQLVSSIDTRTLKILTRASVVLDGVLVWILDLLITYGS